MHVFVLLCTLSHYSLVTKRRVSSSQEPSKCLFQVLVLTFKMRWQAQAPVPNPVPQSKSQSQNSVLCTELSLMPASARRGQVPETRERESQSTNIRAFLRSKYKDCVPSAQQLILSVSHLTSSLSHVATSHIEDMCYDCHDGIRIHSGDSGYLKYCI